MHCEFFRFFGYVKSNPIHNESYPSSVSLHVPLEKTRWSFAAGAQGALWRVGVLAPFGFPLRCLVGLVSSRGRLGSLCATVVEEKPIERAAGQRCLEVEAR